jgi:hypothetical protein
MVAEYVSDLGKYLRGQWNEVEHKDARKNIAIGEKYSRVPGAIVTALCANSIPLLFSISIAKVCV